MNRGRRRTAAPALPALLAAALAVAGCSHDSAGIKEKKTSGGTVKAALARVLPGKTGAPAAAADPAALAAAALGSLQGPVIMVTFEAAPGAPMIGGMVGSNGAMRSYQTPDQRGFVLRDGMLAATRGFGRDLMSADTAAAAALVRAGKAGSAARVYRFLDGEGRERPLPVNCTVTPGGTVAQGGVSARQVAEHCEGSGAVLDMTYLVAGGRILASRQWLGPDLGYLQIQQLRD